MQISWWTLAIQGVNFLVLVWLLQRLLYRPVQAMVEKRRRLVVETGAAADKARADAEALLLRRQQEMAAIATERDAALASGRAAIDAERRKAVEDARQAASKSLAEARVAMQNESKVAFASLQDDVVELAARMARTILADMAASIPDEAVLGRLVHEVETLPVAEQQRLMKDLAANDGRLGVVTASELAADERVTWQAQLETVLKCALTIRFEHDTSLLAGAVLRLPHTSVRMTWADQIEVARQALKGGGNAKLS